MKQIILNTLKLYRILISPVLSVLFGRGCKFEPSCSQYAIGAIEKHGVIKGSKLGAIRLAKCHPLNHSFYFDPVPNQ